MGQTGKAVNSMKVKLTKRMLDAILTVVFFALPMVSVPVNAEIREAVEEFVEALDEAGAFVSG